MAGEKCKRWMSEESNCCICLDFFRDPVMLDCGHNFCKACITRCWEETHPRTACPLCRGTIRFKRLRSNWQLANIADVTRWLTDPRLGEEAVLRRKEEISSSLEVVREKKKNILLLKGESEKESEDFLKQIEAEKENMAASFRDLHQFLEEKEKFLLAQMEEAEKEIVRRRDEHLAKLSEELSSLDSIIQELEEKQKQSAELLLADLGSLFNRCQKESSAKPVEFPASLKWRIHDFRDANPFLKSVMKQFKDTLRSGLSLQEERVTLDPGTAHPHLFLSSDLKTMQWGTWYRALPDNPERFNYWSSVLGSDGFTSGRYFWEVIVRGKGWAMGIARQSVKRKDWFPFNPQEGIWALEYWGWKYHICNSPTNIILPLSQELKRIRVMLNCDGGRVAFFDADTAVQLYEFSDASFRGETVLPFFYLKEPGHMCL